MSRFAVKGQLLGSPASATWDDGQLEGDFDLCGLARAYAEEGVPVSVPGVWSGPADLSKIHSAYATLSDVLGGSVEEFEGDDPWLGWKQPEAGSAA